MGPLAIGMLINGGFKVMGGIADSQRAEAQKEIETATNDANAAIQRANVAKEYTSVFDKMVSDIGTQANIFATAKVDKGSTLFAKGLQEHEKQFLENKANMESDISAINSQRKLGNVQAKLAEIYKKQSIGTDLVTSLTGDFFGYKNYQKTLELNAQRIKNGK